MARRHSPRKRGVIVADPLQKQCRATLLTSFVASSAVPLRQGDNQKEKRRGRPPPLSFKYLRRLKQEQHRLRGLAREREGRLRELLARVEGEQVRAFLIRISESQVIGAALERANHRFGELLPD